MAREFGPKGFSFLFLYTREAHPGENYPAHRSFDDKIHHAKAFKEILQVARPILVDDIAGSAHHAYGCLPNMTYVIGRGGKILFRSDWTDPPTITNALTYILAARTQRREGLRMAPFYSELVGYRWSDQTKFHAGLKRAGQQAVDDFERAMKRKKKSKPGPGRIVLE